MLDPFYNEETLESNRHILRDYLIPLVLKTEIAHPDDCVQLFGSIRRNMMATTLQRQLNTPICLDESIHTPEDARKAIELGSCRII